jgi:hypothetical protein
MRKQIAIAVVSMTVLLAAAIWNPATVAAQPVVVTGTGDPNLDVPAVQAAVDQGGQVILKGHFSFDKSPTIPPAIGGFPLAMVLVSTEVAISGTRDEYGEMTNIEGGQIPFLLEAPGARVAIQGLRFIRPTVTAIFVYAVSGLVIASCRIEGVDPDPSFGSTGVAVNTSLFPPTPDRPGQPENVSGTLLLVNNDIDVVGGTAADNTLGILIFSVGISPDAEVEIHVAGNNIRNTTERAINIYQVGGRAYIERNLITTSTTSGKAGGLAPDVIHVVGSGSYLIANNSIDSQFAKGAGIRVQGQFAQWPIADALVVDNDVTMSAPEGTIFGANSAGIDIRGSAQGTVVLNNRIRGRAAVALSVADQGTLIPSNTPLVLNNLKGFQSSRADVFVDAGVTNTLVVARKGTTIEDHGLGTVVVPIP